jgi:hypothetical protein
MLLVVLGVIGLIVLAVRRRITALTGRRCRAILASGSVQLCGIPQSQPFFGNAEKPPLDDSPGLARSGFSYVFWSTIFVPRTQTFCGNRSRLNDGRDIGLKGSASNERFLARVEIPSSQAIRIPPRLLVGQTYREAASRPAAFELAVPGYSVASRMAAARSGSPRGSRE